MTPLILRYFAKKIGKKISGSKSFQLVDRHINTVSSLQQNMTLPKTLLLCSSSALCFCAFSMKEYEVKGVPCHKNTGINEPFNMYLSN